MAKARMKDKDGRLAAREVRIVWDGRGQDRKWGRKAGLFRQLINGVWQRTVKKLGAPHA